jgi:phage baseplate assembly protein W
MIGMSHTNGRAIDGVSHLVQSCARILTTPRGSRIARRDFGSDLPALIDAPMNQATRVRLFAAAATALMRWEPRLKLTRVGLSIDTDNPGRVVIEIEGKTTISRDLVSASIPLNAGSTSQ